MQSEIVHKLRAHQIMGLVFLSHAQMVTASHELPVGMYVLPEEVTFYVRLLLLPLSSTTNLSTSLSSLSSPPPPVLPLPTPLLTLSIPPTGNGKAKKKLWWLLQLLQLCVGLWRETGKQILCGYVPFHISLCLDRTNKRTQCTLPVTEWLNSIDEELTCKYHRLWFFSACAYKLRLQETMRLTDNVRLTSGIIVAMPSMRNAW